MKDNKNRLQYTGKLEFQPKPPKLEDGDPKKEPEEPLYPYIPTSKKLIEAVNLAIDLKRPLLLEGEPGCGKTQLARAVAYEFTKRYCSETEQKEKKKWPYVDWYIKSSDQARDGLYTYDAVRRLFDAQLAATEPWYRKNKIRHQLNDPKHTDYIKWGALGKAFQASKNDQRMVVLIDEIDKAESDFPNDLLLELEEKRFFVKETGEEVRAKVNYEPIIFITSNGQIKLPDAFLRRCLYHYITFPEKDTLVEIVEARFGKDWSTQLTEKVIDRFIELRKLMEEEKGEFGKKVSTSELIDWFRALHLHKVDEIEELISNKKLPYSSVLLKTRDDLNLADLLKEKEDVDSE